MQIRTALLFVCSLSGVAIADEGSLTLDRVCAAIDEESDGLAAPDREHAVRLLRQVLERENQLVVTSDCTETYLVSHERANDRYVIRVRSSAGRRRMTVPALRELSAKYRKLVRSLLDAKAEQRAASAAPATAETAAPVTAAAPATAETAAFAPGVQATPEAASEPLPPPIAVDEESPPEPTRKPTLWYARLGVRPLGGTGAGLGYRRAFGTTAALDISAAWTYGGERMDSSNMATFAAELLRVYEQSERTSLYAGGGLSLGTIEKNTYDEHLSGGGAHAELTAGIRFGAVKGPQLLVQVDLTLPFYSLDTYNGDRDYEPCMVFSVGGGL